MLCSLTSVFLRSSRKAILNGHGTTLAWACPTIASLA